MHVVFSPDAEGDLDALDEQLSELSELGATRVLLAIVDACLSLSTLPSRHPLEPLDPSGTLHRFNLDRYVILYEVHESRVEIVRVLPGEMDLVRLFTT